MEHWQVILRERGIIVGKFMNGILVGVGVGLLVAPRKGEEMRRMLSERFLNQPKSLEGESQVSLSQEPRMERGAGLTEQTSTMGQGPSLMPKEEPTPHTVITPPEPDIKRRPDKRFER
ncbi:hypothetical protein Krac_2180 [Ktedonobacter racemifer DSM 44963]|uniref:YtxH domain-containing protein n=1 Tax=Ktedonobacter racemifer DSM 44963 TaxID=485913 RepID=D6U4M6_KTERA|nr:hypothetical protein Krac_2180 [Ktedonobacter racemifer DSM 44963]